MQKSRKKQSQDNKQTSKLSISIITPIQQTSQASTQSFQMIVQKRYGSITYHDKSSQQIQQSSQQMIKTIKNYQNIVDKKIIKYYTQLRQKPIQKQFNADQLLQIYRTQQQLRNQLIKFQQYEMKKVKQIQKYYDSIQNVQFAIPIQISQSKKKIQELQSFIHIAQIRQKKRSEDLVKVDKNNLMQFQKCAMLRTTMQIQMIYQLSVNERQVKINDRLYDFQQKIEKITKQLADLNKIVEEKQILVSSNKGLIILKEKKNNLMKLIQDGNKKIMIARSLINNKQTTIKRDIDKMKKQIIQKQQKAIAVDKQLAQIQLKNTSFVIDQTINKSLRKSISYNYAQTLLKMKKNQKINNISIDSNSHKLNMSVNLQNNSSTMKPNFKVKRVNNNHSSLSKVQSPKEDKKSVQNPIQSDQLLPITIDRSKRTYKLLEYNNDKNKISVDTTEKKRSSFYNKKIQKKDQYKYQNQIIAQY